MWMFDAGSLGCVSWSNTVGLHAIIRWVPVAFKLQPMLGRLSRTLVILIGSLECQYLWWQNKSPAICRWLPFILIFSAVSATPAACTHPPSFASPMQELVLAGEMQDLWCEWGMNISRISLKSAKALWWPKCWWPKVFWLTQNWFRLCEACYEGGGPKLRPTGDSPSISLGKCLALPESCGKTHRGALHRKPQWCLWIRQNVWLPVPKAGESPRRVRVACFLSDQGGDALQDEFSHTQMSSWREISF